MGVEANDAQCMVFCRGSDEEKFRLYERAAALGHPYCAYFAGECSEDGRGCPVDLEKAARYYRLAARLGHTFTLDNELQRLQWRDPLSVVPYGEWQPESHRWVTDDIHSEMMAMLLMHQKPGTLFSLLPRDIVLHHILPYICTQPHE